MSGSTATAELGGRLRGPASTALLVAVGVATGAATVVAGGGPLLAVAPVGLVTLLYVLAKAPLRWSAGALLFLVLALDLTRDAAGVWHTPLAGVGDLLQESLERVLELPIPLNGLDLVALFLLAAKARQRLAGSSEAIRESAVGTREFLLLYVGGIVFAEVNGLARGAGAGLYKVRHLMEIPLLALLFERAFRASPADYRLVGRVVVLAACVKAVLALVVQHVAAPALTGGKLVYATNHGDSVLFSLAVFLLLADFAERADVRSFRRVVALAPLLLLGIVANNRRTAWVMLAATLVTAYLMNPWRAWKRAVTRGAVLLLPVVALYAAAGWNRGGRVFAPVATVRTLVDGSVDSSTFWRDVENWNIAMSMRAAPIAGIGLGGEYTEFMKADDISGVFADFRAWPHNSVMGLLLLAGPFAFTAVWSLFGFTVFLAARAFRRAEGPDERTAALGAVAAVIVCAVLAYSDTGAFHAQYRVLGALALVVAGKVAVGVGAWPARTRRLAPPAAPPAAEGST